MFDLFKNKNNNNQERDNSKMDIDVKRNNTEKEDFVEIFKNFKISELMLRVVNSQISFDEINEIFSEGIDEIILSSSRKEKLKFIGGIFRISLKSEKTFVLSFQLFFKTEEEKFLTKSAESGEMLLKYLTEESRIELSNNKYVEFEIDEPKE